LKVNVSIAELKFDSNVEKYAVFKIDLIYFKTLNNLKANPFWSQFLGLELGL